LIISVISVILRDRQLINDVLARLNID